MTCPNCGNPVENVSVTCPYCGSAAKGKEHQPASFGSVAIKRVNLKQDLPTVEEALRMFDSALSSARYEGVKVLKIIHGYGSTGVGGKIKQALRRKLNRMVAEGALVAAVSGEDHFYDHPIGRRLLHNYNSLKTDSDTKNKNPGVTYVVLSM
ncbi:Smr/MutS family protein [bacterium]|nr:Smr/MutS family protein [bacterium]